MLLISRRRQSPPAVAYALRRRLSHAHITAIQRQDARASASPMLDQWTEADVLALPAGEQDYFERKAGALYAHIDRFRGAIAKAASAFANSGGGALILGIEDDGVTFDGLPPTHGAKPTREWIEHVVPNLLAYPLTEFRVHEVIPEATGSTIPASKVVIVLDVGDSPAAPHQCNESAPNADQYVYYMRQGGHSVPAPHHYVELVRQRLTAPTLAAEFGELHLRGAGPGYGGSIFAHLTLSLHVKNMGRIAAYKWRLYEDTLSDVPDGRGDDFVWDTSMFPVYRPDSGIRLDDTILPGGAMEHDIELGVYLRPLGRDEGLLQDEIEALLGPAILKYRLATEVGLSDDLTMALGPGIDPARLAHAIMAQIEPSEPS